MSIMNNFPAGGVDSGGTVFRKATWEEVTEAFDNYMDGLNDDWDVLICVFPVKLSFSPMLYVTLSHNHNSSDLYFSSNNWGNMQDTFNDYDSTFGCECIVDHLTINNESTGETLIHIQFIDKGDYTFVNNHPDKLGVDFWLFDSSFYD